MRAEAHPDEQDNKQMIVERAIDELASRALRQHSQLEK